MQREYESLQQPYVCFMPCPYMRERQKEGRKAVGMSPCSIHRRVGRHRIFPPGGVLPVELFRKLIELSQTCEEKREAEKNFHATE